jgi:SpoIID/LytB domain protein
MLVIDGAGWGHGVGLSQFGAYGMAREGSTATSIVEHFYVGSSIRLLGTDLPPAAPLWVNLERDRDDVTVGTTGPATLTRSGVEAPLPSEASVTTRVAGPGLCEVMVTMDGVTTTTSGDCALDLTSEHRILIEGCTVTDWNAEPAAEAPCGYDHGILHVRPGSSPTTIHVVLELDIEDYLLGIAEMPYRWGTPEHGGMAALEAQAIAARSYAHHLQVSRGDPATSICGGWCHVRDTTWDQRYAGDAHGGADKDRWLAAVAATAGMVLTHPDGNVRPGDGAEGIVLAYYSSSTGGRTEDRAEVWGGDPIPYLQSVDDHWSLDPVNPNASWRSTIGSSIAATRLGVDAVTGARVLDRRVSESAATVEFTGTNGGVPVTVTRTGAWVKSAFGLRSLYFDIRVDPFLPADRVGMHDPLTGIWHQRGETQGIESFYYGNPADQPFAGDWDGDGVDTMGLYRVSAGYLFLRNSNTEGIADVQIYYGDPGDLPLSGDWDGDGIDTVGIYRPSEARFYLRNSNTEGVADVVVTFGDAGDVPLSGDWDGDGIDTVGVFRPSTRTIHLTNGTSGAPLADVTWVYSGSMPDDVVVAGDWDGDGRDTIGLFRPAERRFYLRDELAAPSANRIFDWTGAGTTPVAGDWG